MCKTLAEGGPCFSHKSKAWESIKEKYDQGLDKFARDAGAPTDPAETVNLKVKVTSLLVKNREIFQKELNSELSQAQEIAERGNKNKAFYNVTKQDAAIDAKSQKSGIDRKIVEQALPLVAEYNYQVKQAHKYQRRMELAGFNATNERLDELVNKLRKTYDSNNVSPEDQEKLESTNKVGRTTERSFVHHNALNEVKEVKRKMDITNKKLENISNEQKTHFETIDAKPPISAATMDKYRSQYEQTSEGQKLKQKMNKTREEMEATSEYVAQAMLQYIESKKNKDAPEKVESLRDQLDELMVNRDIVLQKYRMASVK